MPAGPEAEPALQRFGDLRPHVELLLEDRRVGPQARELRLGRFDEVHGAGPTTRFRKATTSAAISGPRSSCRKCAAGRRSSAPRRAAAVPSSAWRIRSGRPGPPAPRSAGSGCSPSSPSRPWIAACRPSRDRPGASGCVRGQVSVTVSNPARRRRGGSRPLPSGVMPRRVVARRPAVRQHLRRFRKNGPMIGACQVVQGRGGGVEAALVIGEEPGVHQRERRNAVEPLQAPRRRLAGRPSPGRRSRPR